MRTFSSLLCIGLLVLGGCGGESKSERPGLPPVTTEPFQVEDGENDPLADPRAEFGGEYTTWGGGYPRALNYWLDFNALAGQVCGLMFEPLVTLHPVEARAIGAAAKSWEISEDGMVFDFEIHPAARWSDGVPVTAEDFQFYYDVIMNPRHLTSPFRVELDRLERPEVLDAKRLRVRAKTRHWSSLAS
ncbi:MAG: ABC transporter substrate-binding protein, partial [Verrucomicrobiia bacterium]